jgi:lactate permease
MVMMALVMNDSGMTNMLALGMAEATGSLFPIVAPFIGVLGSFLTGSNTNSNVMFGALQIETAKVLGISTVIMAAVQSVGGSVGCSIAPSKVLIGSATVGLNGRESEILNRTIPYCMLITLLVGINAWIFAYVLFKNLL